MTATTTANDRPAWQLEPFADIPLDAALLEHLLEHHDSVTLPRLARLWRYFRNELAEPTDEGGSRSAPAQEAGLPLRLRPARRAGEDDRVRREVVIENDIGWRVNTLVDFMFPAAPRLVSRARDAATRRAIESALDDAITAAGGVTLWQVAALLGSVYGHVDFLLDAEDLFTRTHVHTDARSGVAATGATQDAPTRSGGRESPASLLRIEAVEAPRAIPLLHPSDYRVLDAYILHAAHPRHFVEEASLLSRVLASGLARLGLSGRARPRSRSRRASSEVIIIHSASHMQRYEDGRLVHEARSRLGRVPVIHVQNLAQPFLWEGLSDVEPLIPLQDELNTRVSDRANRVTMQSFRMWLGKGIEGFTDRPVGPGQMWMTDNENASIEAFGGDADSPSERAHIEELREALDKASGVTPAAAGHIKARVGNLTSENALRISLMGTLAKVKRKRITYGRGIEALADLILHALHVAGALRTDPRDRAVEIAWPDPLPIDESRRLQDALIKAQLGVPSETLRAELGYADAEG
jgi:hypothetical protein